MSETTDNKMRSGRCCSVTIMEAGLEYLGKENPDLLNAMKALCGGFAVGKICGALSGALCLIRLAVPEEEGKTLCVEMISWFNEFYSTTDCSRLVPSQLREDKQKACPSIVSCTFEMVCDLLGWDEPA
jgi:C_GCAxxG_C_C family probable redox protein